MDLRAGALEHRLALQDPSELGAAVVCERPLMLEDDFEVTRGPTEEGLRVARSIRATPRLDIALEDTAGPAAAAEPVRRWSAPPGAR